MDLKEEKEVKHFEVVLRFNHLKSEAKSLGFDVFPNNTSFKVTFGSDELARFHTLEELTAFIEGLKVPI